MRPLSGDDPVQIGRYLLRSRLGAGGMGNVYLASTPAGRPVALKVVRPELSHDPEFRARFHQEIQAAQRVRGLYTAELVDADPEADPPWLATAYVPGPSLQQVLDTHGPMPETQAFRLIAGVAEALQAIHSANVVHRDLKPSNVVLGPDGPRVIDFGIARALEASALTGTGMSVGTPQFMAPEQLQNLPVTPMIDIFALGTLAANAVLGRPPFGGGHPSAVYYRIVHEPPDLNGCPPQMRALIEPCLAKHPADRPQLSQIIRFCLERADMASGPVPGQAPYQPPHQPTQMVAREQPIPTPTMTAGVAPQRLNTGMPSRIVPPQPVINAVRLIYLGSLLAVCRIAAAVISRAPALRAALHLHGASDATITGTVITGLVAACVWLAIAMMLKRGWTKTRIVASALFGINSIVLLSSNAGGISNYLTFLFDVAIWGAGLVAILSLWNVRSTVYFTELDRAKSFATPDFQKATLQSGPRHSKT
jgi:Protein kinase domain